MLKKIRKFWIILTLVMGFSCLFCGARLFSGNLLVSAFDMPSLEGPESGENWEYDNFSVLTLNGVDWDSSLFLTGDLTINLVGENRMNTGDESAIYTAGYNLKFTGTGSLVIQGSPVIYDENFQSTIELDNLKATIGSESGDTVSELSLSQISDVDYIKIFSGQNNLDYKTSPIAEDEGDIDETTKGTLTITTTSTSTTLTLSDLVDYSGPDHEPKYDLSKLFTFSAEDCGDKHYYVYDENVSDWIVSDIQHSFASSGTYKIKVVVDENDKYYTAEKEHEVVIQKVNLTNVTLTVNDWIYGGTPSWYMGNDTYTIDEIYQTVEYYYDEAHNQKVEGIPTEVGTYYAVGTISEAPFTNSATASATFKITPKIIGINWLTGVDFTYNGTVQIVTASYKDINGNDIELNVDFGDKEFKNAGNYDATVSFKNNETNYKLPSNATQSYTMRKVGLTLEINSISNTFGNEPQPIVLSAEISGGRIVEGEEPYSLSLEENITSSTPIGQYNIKGTNLDTLNYDITFMSGYYYVNNAIFNLKLDSWTYGETASTPTANAYALQESIVYSYYKVSDYGQLTQLSGKPTNPGHYRVKATINDSAVYNKAEADIEFFIYKIKVGLPSEDKNVYVYDGKDKVYNIQDNSIYTIENQKQKESGTYKVKISLKDSTHYEWENGSDKSYIEYLFVIQKKEVEIPSAVSNVYKYTGSPIKFLMDNTEEYRVSANNIQTEPGEYIISVSLVDPKNTKWSNGSSEAIEYKFIINQSNITNGNTTDASGNVLSSSPVTIISSSGNGIASGIKLNVKIVDESDTSAISGAKKSLKSNLKKYSKIFAVYDVKLMDGDKSVQPNGMITLKMKIPEKLSGAKFTLFHIHIDENGNEVVSEIDYNGVSEDGYIIFQTEKLSSFAFVHSQDSLMPLIILFACLSLIMLALLILQFILFYKNKKTNIKTTLASVVPVFFVQSEVTLLVVLGVVLGCLIIANIVMGSLILKRNKLNRTKENSVVDMSNKKNNRKSK